MKTTIIPRKITVVAVLAMIALTASAQGGPRSSARKNGSEANKARSEQNRNSQTRVERTSKEQDKKNTYQYRDERRQPHNTARSRTESAPDRYKAPQPTQAHKHVYHKPAAKQASVHHKHAYHKHLPAKHIDRIYHNGNHYFHAGKHFYTYHPGHGYVVFDPPFPKVRVLPPRCEIRIINEMPYAYLNGYLFLPMEVGYVMVPAPPHPHLSFNVSIGF